MCAVDKIQTAGDQAFMAGFKLDGPPIGPIRQWNYPMRQRPVIRLYDSSKREMSDMNWGLVPFWAKDIKIGRNAFNCRFESLIEGKPMFRAAFKNRRCLIPATSYIEHRGENGKKVAYEFSIDGGQAYAYAGVWESWKVREAKIIAEDALLGEIAISEPEVAGVFLSTSMITTVPNEIAEQYHTRMPAILNPENYEKWLDPASKPNDLLELLIPLEASRMSVKHAMLPGRGSAAPSEG